MLPLQIAKVVGSTFNVKIVGVPAQPFGDVGVTRKLPLIEFKEELVAAKAAILPVPLKAVPIAALLLVQV